MDIKLRVKPLSANSMYWKRGKLTKKTKIYEEYQQEILDELRGIEWPFGNRQVAITVVAGLSARQADLDNILKPLLDTLQVIYDDFNDNKVYHIDATKVITAKGQEFLNIKVQEHVDTTKELHEEAG